MTIPPSDLTMKNRLLEAAAQLLADEGTSGLTTRKISAAAGTTTMSVYTRFGSIENLVNELVLSGFSLLEEELLRVKDSEDTLTHLARLTAAYLQHARQHPALYRIMFGTIALGEFRPVKRETLSTGKYTLELVVQTLQRLIDEGTIHPGNAFLLANEWWVLAHGYVLLELTGYFEASGSIPKVLIPLLQRFFVGLGADADQVSQAIGSAIQSQST